MEQGDYDPDYVWPSFCSTQKMAPWFSGLVVHWHQCRINSASPGFSNLCSVTIVPRRWYASWGPPEGSKLQPHPYTQHTSLGCGLVRGVMPGTRYRGPHQLRASSCEAISQLVRSNPFAQSEQRKTLRVQHSLVQWVECTWAHLVNQQFLPFFSQCWCSFTT